MPLHSVASNGQPLRCMQGVYIYPLQRNGATEIEKGE